ncbi:polysaccharide biosynthesis tyrosine autokinase [Micrococcus luteus]|nr:polysaccharide biosynthesis tyrosine autokinase [Micrococcus luteus]MCV7588119.1 polysaccharide biosynthesis tyrosine autokinase [Micrococcus luteus]
MTVPPHLDAAPDSSVSLRDVLRFVRRYWPALLVAPLVGVLATALWSIVQTPRYTSTTSAVVSIGAADNIGVALTADNLAKSKAQQYAELGDSRALAESVVQELSFPLSVEDALEATGVESAPGGALLEITAEESTSERAQELSQAWTQALAERVQDLESSESAPGSSIISVEILADANLPASPSWPNIPLVLALGAGTGLLIGLGYALARHLLDNRIRSSSMIEERYGLSILGTIPQVGRPKKDATGARARIFVDQQAETHNRATFRTTEAFKELRTNIDFLRPDDAPQVITVTSAHPGEGKSSIVTNLAVTLAQAGREVVLIDADLRRPVLSETLGLVGGVGVTDVMLGQATVRDVAQTVVDLPNLSFIGAGRIPPNPSEILGSDRFHDMVRSLADNALVLIDAPPLLPVTDGAILARRFDGCVLVVSAGRPTVDELDKAISNVQNIGGHILGVVLNRVPTTGSEASSYHYYGQTYYGQEDTTTTRGG